MLELSLESRSARRRGAGLGQRRSGGRPGRPAARRRSPSGRRWRRWAARGAEALADALRPGAGRRAARGRHHARLRAGARRPHQPEEPGDRRSRAVGRAPGRRRARRAPSSAGCRRPASRPAASTFPGTATRSVDSHLELPLVEHAPDRLRGGRVRAVPRRHRRRRRLHHDRARAGAVARRGAAGDAVAAGSLRLLREELGFDGVILSDDLEMKAIAQRAGRRAEAAVRGDRGRLRRRARLQRRRRRAGRGARGARPRGRVRRAAAGPRRRRAGAAARAKERFLRRRAAGRAAARRALAGGGRLRGAPASSPPRWRRSRDASRPGRGPAGAGRAACSPATASPSSPRPARSTATSSSAGAAELRAPRLRARCTTTACFARHGYVAGPAADRGRRRSPRRGATRRFAASSPCAAATAAQQLLPLLDPRWLAGDPKVVHRLQRPHGAADVADVRCGMVAFHGPMLDGRLARGRGGLRPRRRSWRAVTPARADGRAGAGRARGAPPRRGRRACCSAAR